MEVYSRWDKNIYRVRNYITINLSFIAGFIFYSVKIKTSFYFMLGIDNYIMIVYTKDS